MNNQSVQKPLNFISDTLASYLSQITEWFDDEIATELLTIKAFSSISEMWGKAELASRITDYACYLDFDPNAFMLSFLPKGKNLVYSNGNLTKKNWISGKISRVLHKILIKQYTDHSYEVFNNHLKAIVLGADYKWNIVTGKDIAYWYNETHYNRSGGGTLSNSCMRHTDNQDWFEIYTNNPYCSMLILTKYNRLVGRALLWTIDNNVYMDRVYYSADEIYSKFIQYAKKNKWRIRYDNSLLSDEEDCFFKYLDDGKTWQYEYSELKIPVKSDYDWFPYLDSFRYFYRLEGHSYLSNVYNDNLKDCIRFLSDSDGSYTSYNACCCCGTHILSDEGMWSDYLDDYLCDNCATYSEYQDSYIAIDTAVKVFYDRSFDTYDYVDQDCVDAAFDSFANIGDDWFFIDNEEMIKIDDNWYWIDECECDENGEYKPIE